MIKVEKWKKVNIGRKEKEEDYKYENFKMKDDMGR